MPDQNPNLESVMLQKASSIGPNQEAKASDNWKYGVMPTTPASAKAFIRATEWLMPQGASEDPY